MKRKANMKSKTSSWIVPGAVFQKKHSRSNTTWVIKDIKSFLVFAQTNDEQARPVKFLRVELEHFYEPVEAPPEDEPEDPPEE